MRLIDATLAQGLSEAKVCGDAFRFPEDEIDAVCVLTVGLHQIDTFHQDKTHTRRWRYIGHGDVEGMIRPGSEPLRAEVSE